MDFAGEDKAVYVQRTFDAIAEKYDFMNKVMSMGLDKRWRNLTVKQVGAKPGMRILDVCCGTGRLSLALNEAVGAEGAVTGLDFSENMIRIAEQSLSRAASPGSIQFVRGDAMELPFPDQSFDGATVGWGLRNLPDLRQGIRELARVVRPGGRVVSLDMAKPSLPVYREVYWLYFEKIIPLLGRILTRKAGAYKYLYESAREFPAQSELAEIFAVCGLQETGFRNLAGGAVAIVSGIKP